MAKKAPRRTAERILSTTLALFNRFGEPNVSTTLISSELSISPGNLYYHFPAKDELVTALFEQYQARLFPILAAGAHVSDVEEAWFFLHSLFELIWEYRFLYRDLGDLLSKNRRLEKDVKDILLLKTSACRALLQGLGHQGHLHMQTSSREMCATQMVVMLTWWLSFEFAKDPRHALEDDNAQQALLRGAQHVLSLLVPYLEDASQAHLLGLIQNYSDESEQHAQHPHP
jgi:AcrR family transcriptional regulator